MAGIGTEVCGRDPALHAHRDGYQVVFVADACGSATAIGHDISRRMQQAASGHHAAHHCLGECQAGRRLPKALADHAGRLTPTGHVTTDRQKPTAGEEGAEDAY
jgi:hypothetical protein